MKIPRLVERVLDDRPRYPFVLPDGAIANIIFDHGETPPPFIDFTLAGGKIITIPLSPVA